MKITKKKKSSNGTDYTVDDGYDKAKVNVWMSMRQKVYYCHRCASNDCQHIGFLIGKGK